MSNNGLKEEMIMAGFGGQGIILAGKLIAQAAMKEGKEVTYMPAYGAEVRGGTANCMVVIADNPVASPVISGADSLIIMNKASMERFAPRLRKNGLLIMNSSLIDETPELDTSIDVLKLPADDIAKESGSIKSANMAALGAYAQKKGIFSVQRLMDCLEAVLAKRYHKTIPMNSKALKLGAEFAEKN